MGINLALALVAAFAAASAALPVAAAEVAVVVAGRTTAGSGFSIEGRIEPIRQATVAAQVGGNVPALLVKAGQVLARIDERDAMASLARSNAAVAQAEAFTAFVGANLLQFGFTNVCPLGIILRKLGVPEGTR